MGSDCDCGSEEKPKDTPAKQPSSTEAAAGKKVEKLKESIEELGFKVEETPEGDIKVLE